MARETDPELALAHHLDHERQRLRAWYPWGDVWRESEDYLLACEQFNVHVMAVLENDEVLSDDEHTGE